MMEQSCLPQHYQEGKEEGKGRGGKEEEVCFYPPSVFVSEGAPSLLESAVYMRSVSLSGATPIYQSSLEMPLHTHPDRSLLIF